jgi:hypothetical protein
MIESIVLWFGISGWVVAIFFGVAYRKEWKYSEMLAKSIEDLYKKEFPLEGKE